MVLFSVNTITEVLGYSYEPGSTPRGDHADPPPSVAFVVSRLGFSVSQALADGLKPLGIDPQHFGLLRALLFSEGQSQRAIGAVLSIPPNRMVALVDDLEERGRSRGSSTPPTGAPTP